jgi:hypothetical protein
MNKLKLLAVSEKGILDDDNYRPCIGHKDNLQALREAFEENVVCLMEVTLKATGERVAALCTAAQYEDGDVSFTPFAIMLNGNPFALLDPPSTDQKTPCRIP